MKKSPFSEYPEDKIHPGFSVDCVILSFHKNKIKVLLKKYTPEHPWALLGGFVFNDESADQAANRVLKANTSVDKTYLQQFHLFSDPDRIVKSQIENYVSRNASEANDGKWMLKRFITMGYYALLKYDEVRLPDKQLQTLAWFDIRKLPPLYSDHGNIIGKALEMIKTIFPAAPIAYQLLPEKFTMTELRKVHEILLDKEFDRRNFQRKVLSEGEVIQLQETKSDKTYNAPILYMYNNSANRLF